MFCLRTVSAVFAAGLFLSAATYAQQTPRATSPATAKDTLNQEDKKFVQEAATDGMAEVELSKIAQKSENPDIKRFADRMVQDHMAANQELMSVTGGLGIETPKALDHEHEQMRQKLTTLHGKALDDQYMQVMVQDHNKTVNLFQQEERSGSSTQLKSFAAKALPILKDHQTMATEIARKAKQASVR
jgi:putative membrane protein